MKIENLKIKRDVNGNKVLCIKPICGRAFTIQTNGNLPLTHRNGITEDTCAEVEAYVSIHGTLRQKLLLTKREDKK